MPPGLVRLPSLLVGEEVFAELLDDIPWEERRFRIFGRTMPMPRLIQMYGPHGYRYSGQEHPPRPLTPVLEELRQQVEQAAGLPFNSVLLNLYRDGRDSMGWHTDDDYPHGGQPAVASLSLGAPRRFRLRPRSGAEERVELELRHGELILLSGEALSAWSHCVPKERGPVGPRINLTWRHLVGR